MANWNGYRAPRAACGGALNGYRSPKAKQAWTPGDMVKVGFMSLEVVAKVATPGDGRPDEYRLWNPANGKKYTFTPHLGLNAGWEIA